MQNEQASEDELDKDVRFSRENYARQFKVQDELLILEELVNDPHNLEEQKIQE